MLQLVILADDFTGALDTAAKLASRHIPCYVTSNREISASDLPSGYDVLTIDTETRHILPEKAYSIYLDLCRKWAKSSRYLYIKTDSVLRGNISAALAGAIDGTGCPAAFIPAFPAAGRITCGGKHFVNGIPLEQSPFAADPLNPAITSNISTIISQDYPIDTKLVSQGEELSCFPQNRCSERCALLFDCSADRDLEQIGENLKSLGLLRLTAGCAGFASRFPELLPFRFSFGQGTCPGGVFLLSGSANDITYQQLDAGERSGWEILSPEWEDILEETVEPVLARLETSFYQSGSSRAALAISRSRSQAEGFTRFAASCGLDGKQLHDKIQRFIQKLVPSVLERIPIYSFAVFGGDALFSSLEALQCRSLRVQGEIESGVPFSLVNIHKKDYTIISKSGGLGSIGVLDAIGNACSPQTSDK